MYEVISGLESPTEEERLDALRDAVGRNDRGILDTPTSGEVNNHVHTHYSFSPYSPASAAYMARKSGLEAVGSVDHDSIGAAREMAAAARILGIGSTVGAELRVRFVDTPFADVRLNNPDSIGIAYIVLHGVPASRIDELQRFLRPLQSVRNARNRRQVVRLNDIIVPAGLDPVDFDSDVLPLSWSDRGGSVTERHILYALAIKLEAAYGRGEALIRFIEGAIGLTLADRQRAHLTDADNPHYLYDLLGVFKGRFVERFFIQPAEEECLPVRRVTVLARELGSIPAYAYLGDVGDSPTGDKKAQRFEDAYVEELAAALPEIGFQAITYMPPRNTAEQLRTVQRLAASAGLMEISGVDINSRRQAFTCREVMRSEFSHLNTTTWALIAHETLASHDERYGLFHADNPLAGRSLSQRIERYAHIGREGDPHRPEEMVSVAPAL